MKGTYEFTIEGKKRGFRFNFLAFDYMEEISGLPLDEIIAKITSKTEKKVRLLNQFFFSAAKNYTESKGEEVDFDMNDTADWINEIGFEQAFKLITEAIGAKTPKNSKPLPMVEGANNGAS